ncbi:MAG: copper homeostasis periplasmic binding protein CopC [Caulobacterales bacterium]|nr:copper homeostasis periplasmic binding protein CopC [Caulobacterales bacterium]
MPTRRLILASIAVLSLAAPTAVQAHARLVSASPARDSVGTSPASIRLTFSERMVPAFSSLEIVNAAGAVQPVRSEVSRDGVTITATPTRALRAGSYTVNWAIASNDGHRMTGSYGFTVH